LLAAKSGGIQVREIVSGHFERLTLGSQSRACRVKSAVHDNAP
jgi:hypothetical protein